MQRATAGHHSDGRDARPLGRGRGSDGEAPLLPLPLPPVGELGEPRRQAVLGTEDDSGAGETAPLRAVGDVRTSVAVTGAEEGVLLLLLLLAPDGCPAATLAGGSWEGIADITQSVGNCERYCSFFI